MCGIKICSECGSKILPTSDGNCPACLKPLKKAIYNKISDENNLQKSAQPHENTEYAQIKEEKEQMGILKLLFSFQGRIGRETFWISYLFLTLVSWFLGAISSKSVLFALIFFVVLIWTSLAIQAKRWHDRNMSAWFILVNFTVVGLLWVLLELGFLEGTKGPNKFGYHTF